MSYRKRVGTGIYRSETGYYSIRYKVDGKAVDRGGFRTIEEARVARNRALADASRGIKQRPRRVTVLDFAAEFMPRYTARVRPNTARTARSSLVNHILPALGREPVQDLSPRGLQAWVDAVGAKSPTAAHSARALLSVMLDEAVRMELLYRNPLQGVRNPPVTPAPRITLSAEELARYLDVVDEPGLAWIALTGCRIGEARAMEWTDLNLGRGVWVIAASTSDYKASFERQRPKTPASMRPVPVSDRMRMLLPPQGQGLVWGRWSYQHWLRAHQWACTRASVQQVRIHDLRHTWATLALAAGAHPKLVQQQLGHAKLATTMDTYSHVLPELTRLAAEAVEALLIPPPSEGISVGIVAEAEAILRLPRSDEEPEDAG